MDELFVEVDNNFKVSMADSTMMSILHSAMNKAHAKVQSKDGVIERLNEQSKFYEIAIMQLEACLKFVQEEAGNYTLETKHNGLLFDLLEMKDKLKERLEETDVAIAEKDKELMERFENEKRLTKKLKAKEKELECFQKISKGDGKFNQLKHSLDQHVWNMKQHLEDEKKALTRRFSLDSSPFKVAENLELIDVMKSHCMENKEERSFSNVDYDYELELGYGQMGLEIDRLKKTLDTTFEVMSSTLSRSNDHPLELQWTWIVEKDILSTIFKDFLKSKNKDLQLIISCEDNYSISTSPLCLIKFSSFIDDMELLRDELKEIIFSYEAKANHFKHYDTHQEVDIDDDHVLRKHFCEDLEGEKCSLEKSLSYFKNKYKSKIINSVEKVLQRVDIVLPWLKILNSNYIRDQSNNNVKFLNDKQTIAQQHDKVEQHMKESNNKLYTINESKSLTKDCNIQLDDELLIESYIKDDICMNIFVQTIKEMKQCEENMANNSQNLLEDITFISHLNEELLLFILREVIKYLGTTPTKDYVLFNEKQENNRGKDVLTNGRYISELNSKSSRFIEEEVKASFVKEMKNIRSLEYEDYKYEFCIRESVQWCIVSEVIKYFAPLFVTKITKITDVKRIDSIIKELDSLISEFNVEEMKISKSMDENGALKFIFIEAKDRNEEKIHDELQLKDDFNIMKVTPTSEKALQQLDVVKTLMREIENDKMRKSQKLCVRNMEKTRCNDNYSHPYPSQLTRNLELPSMLFDHNLLCIQELDERIVIFRCMVQEKLDLTNSRLEKISNQVQQLSQEISSLKRKKSLYKTAFRQRCQNLQKAEFEVDILGDTVDVLTTLLKRIYSTLDHYAILLQPFPEAKEPRNHQKFKHVLRRYHLLREFVERKDVEICKIGMDDNIADPLTKLLPQVKHNSHLAAMGVRHCRD